MTDIDFTRHIVAFTIKPERYVHKDGDNYILVDFPTFGGTLRLSDILSVTYAKEKVKRGYVVKWRGCHLIYEGTFKGALLFRLNKEGSEMAEWNRFVRKGEITRNGETLTIEDFEE